MSKTLTDNHYSKTSPRIKARYKEYVKENHSALIKKGSPSEYQIKVKETFSSKDDSIRKLDFGTRVLEGMPEKVLMLVGATGSGKTTLINGIFNHILGVKWDDPFRFRLVDETEQVTGKTQAGSQTSWITSYTIHYHYCLSVPFTLTIIDTPGFGDTKGIKKDRKITEQIRKFFSIIEPFGIDHIDAVCIVVPAALPRLTATQKYIFDSILALFGKDIKNNIFMFLTFADGQNPEALAAIESANIPYESYAKLNNSSLFAENAKKDDDEDDDRDDFGETFWKMSNKTYKKFLLSDLDKMERTSLALTKAVLEKRDKLETSIKKILNEIRKQLLKREEVMQEQKLIEEHEEDIENNKDFKYEVTVENWESRVTELKAVNCTTCKVTCHYPCHHHTIIFCTIGWWLRCVYCGCSIRKHIRKRERYEFVPKTISKTKDEMLKKYEDAKGKKLSAIKMKKKTQNELIIIQQRLLRLNENAKGDVEELSRITLKQNASSTSEYIDLLIESEKKEGKQDWMEHVKELEEMKERSEYLTRLFDEPSGKFDGTFSTATK